MIIGRILTGVFCGLLASAAAAADQATYEVPPGGDLSEAVIVPIQHARLVRSGDRLRLDYRLPPELDGVEAKRFKLSGVVTEQPFTLQGDGVSSSCVETPSETTCVMNYGTRSDGTPFTVNHEAAYDYLQSTVQDPAAIERLQLAGRVLEHQAVGIVTIRRR